MLRPDLAPAVAAVHERLLPHVPAPPCTIADGPGILRLGLLRGASLGSCLRRGRPRAPTPDELLELLDRLDAAALPGEPDAGSDARLRRHVRLLRALVPEESDRLERLSDALSGAARQPTVTIHGDFHEGNILVGEQGISGLLDVDDAGPGERVEDLGLLVGRVWSLAHGRAGEPALRYAENLLRRWDAVVDPAELRRRVGVALVGRATAPFRNQLDGWRRAGRARGSRSPSAGPAGGAADARADAAPAAAAPGWRGFGRGRARPAGRRAAPRPRCRRATGSPTVRAWWYARRARRGRRARARPRGRRWPTSWRGSRRPGMWSRPSAPAGLPAPRDARRAAPRGLRPALAVPPPFL